jgi:hypothetical protein
LTVIIRELETHLTKGEAPPFPRMKRISDGTFLIDQLIAWEGALKELRMSGVLQEGT